MQELNHSQVVVPDERIPVKLRIVYGARELIVVSAVFVFIISCAASWFFRPNRILENDYDHKAVSALFYDSVKNVEILDVLVETKSGLQGEGMRAEILFICDKIIEKSLMNSGWKKFPNDHDGFYDKGRLFDGFRSVSEMNWVKAVDHENDLCTIVIASLSDRRDCVFLRMDSGAYQRLNSQK